MRKIDYMQDPLDFCLYPNEVVQRFSGREVIVYGTNYESHAFLQIFSPYLKIKHIINHFDSDFLTADHIQDLDELLLFSRTTEPIFILSRNFWVEIIDYLERKGLVLGSDLFLLEQGLPINHLISEFINHNKKLWSHESISSKNKILIPFSNSWHDAGASVYLAYCGNYLAKIYNAEIFCYIRYGKERDLMCMSKSAREVARSYNIAGILDVECSQQQLIVAKKLFNHIWAQIHTWQDVKNLSIDGINFGISMIRDYLRVDFSKAPYLCTAEDGTEIEADTVIIATGASAKYLGLDDERKYNGQGVSACATCDGFFYRKKTVAVVGGGDTACEDALYLSGLAKKVYLIVRKPFLRASQVMQQRVKERENIEILFEHNTIGLFGENGVEGAHLVKRKGEPDEELVDIAIDGFFLAIGHKPNTDIFKEWLDTDEVGYLKKIDGTPRTKIPGVFVAGDCADPVYRQAISAAGSGCQAAIEAERFLLNR